MYLRARGEDVPLSDVRLSKDAIPICVQNYKPHTRRRLAGSGGSGEKLRQKGSGARRSALMSFRFCFLWAAWSVPPSSPSAHTTYCYYCYCVFERIWRYYITCRTAADFTKLLLLYYTACTYILYVNISPVRCVAQILPQAGYRCSAYPNRPNQDIN